MNDESGIQAFERASGYYESHVELFMPQCVGSLVAAVTSSGDVVLDLACGTGIAARAGSVAIGPTGRIEGSDLNASEEGSEHE